jgi:hypothetical protein
MKNFLRSGRSRSLYLSIGRVIKQTVIIVDSIIFVSYIQNSNQHHTLKINPIGRGNYWDHLVDFDATDQLMITYSAYVIYLRKMGIQSSSASGTYKLQETP